MPRFFESEQDDYKLTLSTIDGFAEGLGIRLGVDDIKISSIIRLMWQEFPARGGLTQASTFKKAACFFCYFIAERPVQTTFSESQFGDLVAIPNHQNVMIAYNIVSNMLDGATIVSDDGSVKYLDKPLRLSKHSYCDLVFACRNLVPHSDFHTVALLFEQISYRNNPDASYPVLEF